MRHRPSSDQLQGHVIKRCEHIVLCLFHRYNNSCMHDAACKILNPGMTDNESDSPGNPNFSEPETKLPPIEGLSGLVCFNI